MTRFRSYLELIRFPNLFTAMADIVAGAWVAVGLSSGSPLSLELVALLFSSAALYAMGIVMNDYFDFELDCKERPERPLPSGKISRSSALSLGVALGLAGMGLAALVNGISLFIAVVIVGCALLYDRYTKHSVIAGPLTMGICRGLNLLLGVSLVAEQVAPYWWLSGFGFLYIFSVTTMSQGETGDGTYPNRVRLMTITLCVCALGSAFLIHLSPYAVSSLLAVVLFLGWTFSAVGPALRMPTAELIRKAVGRCIVGLPLLDAAVATPFGGWAAFGSVMVFLLLGTFFSRLFAVT